MLFNNFINIFNTFIMELANRIAEVIKYSNLSVRAFGIKCGIAQALMDKYSKGISGGSCLYFYIQVTPDMATKAIRLVLDKLK